MPFQNYTFQQAVNCCHVRSAIFRMSKPEIKYWKNHPESIESRVSTEDKEASDWAEYDPREYDNTSLSGFND